MKKDLTILLDAFKNGSDKIRTDSGLCAAVSDLDTLTFSTQKQQCIINYIHRILKILSEHKLAWTETSETLSEYGTYFLEPIEANKVHRIKILEMMIEEQNPQLIAEYIMRITKVKIICDGYMEIELNGKT